MPLTTNTIFKGLQIAAWIIFIGLAIEAGGLIINLILSVARPDLVGDLYESLDLRLLHSQSKWAFYSMFSLVISVAVLKANVFFVVINLIQKLDLKRPFSSFVSARILQISYYTFSVGMVSHIAKQSSRHLTKRGFEIDQLSEFWVDSQAYMLMAGVIYLIAFIFKKGLEIQEENDLTV